MIIYIAGPMTGIKNYNAIAFFQAEKDLSEKGHTVLNPANHIPRVKPELINSELYLEICLAMVNACNAIYLLKGWEQSDGAKRELLFAVNRGMKIFLQGDLP